MSKEVCPTCGQIIRKKHFIPPTLEDIKQYQKDNPELLIVNAEMFFRGFNDGGWIDTQGKPVRNWKLKLRTWASHSPENGKIQPQKATETLCACGCGKVGDFVEVSGRCFASAECKKKVLGW